MASKIPQTSAGFDRSRIIERPDGFYWLSEEDSREYGPFATLAEAVDDMELADVDETIDVDELEEVEDEIGIADWIDPDTGELAEASVPHIEDH
ncbi:MAG: hypothetical protein N3C63_01100 [Rhodocyclaceae bacterium]|nr:hypothetical protein [Rhodocyclaceae bacterium]